MRFDSLVLNWPRGSTAENNQSQHAPHAGPRPFGASALRSRRLLGQAPRPPADA
jgi:hypothetical protein